MPLIFIALFLTPEVFTSGGDCYSSFQAQSSIILSAPTVSDQQQQRCRRRLITKTAGSSALMKWGSEVATALFLTLFLVERKCAPSTQSANKEAEAPLRRVEAARKLLMWS